MAAIETCELRDYRGRISVLADVAIDAEAKATGRERQEIVREILDAWAVQKVHAASLLQAALDAEGISGSGSGISGHSSKG